jgi:hypothetical protein
MKNESSAEVAKIRHGMGRENQAQHVRLTSKQTVVLQDTSLVLGTQGFGNVGTFRVSEHDAAILVGVHGEVVVEETCVLLTDIDRTAKH